MADCAAGFIQRSKFSHRLGYLLVVLRQAGVFTIHRDHWYRRLSPVERLRKFGRLIACSGERLASSVIITLTFATGSDLISRHAT
jgi:hypothetical protein